MQGVQDRPSHSRLREWGVASNISPELWHESGAQLLGKHGLELDVRANSIGSQENRTSEEFPWRR